MIDPINELRKRLKTGTQAALAEEIGVSPPFLCLVLKGTKAPGAKILGFLGLKAQKVRRYERINGNGRDSSPSAKRMPGSRAPRS